MELNPITWLKKHWTDVVLFVWASLWTAGGIYMAVDVATTAQAANTMREVLEAWVFLNVAALFTYWGITTQVGMYKEMTSENRATSDC